MRTYKKATTTLGLATGLLLVASAPSAYAAGTKALKGAGSAGDLTKALDNLDLNVKIKPNVSGNPIKAPAFTNPVRNPGSAPNFNANRAAPNFNSNAATRNLDIGNSGPNFNNGGNRNLDNAGTPGYSSNGIQFNRNATNQYDSVNAPLDGGAARNNPGGNQIYSNTGLPVNRQTGNTYDRVEGFVDPNYSPAGLPAQLPSGQTLPPGRSLYGPAPGANSGGTGLARTGGRTQNYGGAPQINNNGLRAGQGQLRQADPGLAASGRSLPNGTNEAPPAQRPGFFKRNRLTIGTLALTTVGVGGSLIAKDVYDEDGALKPAANTVGDWGEGAVDDVKDWGEGAVDTVEGWFD